MSAAFLSREILNRYDMKRIKCHDFTVVVEYRKAMRANEDKLWMGD